MLTVITTTFNAENHIPALIKSLEIQSNPNFIWLVYDACSTDRTIDLIKSSDISNINVVSEPDFGIFDAINKAIKNSSTDYYIFCGADDTLAPDAIDTYTNAILDFPNSDIITAPVVINKKIISRRNVHPLIGFQMTLISAHAVGCCINKSLHNTVGFYDKRYWSCADALFVMRSHISGAKFTYIDKCVGEYGTSGESAQYAISAMCGIFRIQTEELGWNLPLCLSILNLKLIKFWMSKKISSFFRCLF
jgi:glycosyltransferase involved in cell wall biosynthesis